MVMSTIINLHSIMPVIIAKLKTKTTQSTKICEYKVDTGSDDSLIPIGKFKVLFPNTKIDNLKSKKSIDKQ